MMEENVKKMPRLMAQAGSGEGSGTPGKLTNKFTTEKYMKNKFTTAKYVDV